MFMLCLTSHYPRRMWYPNVSSTHLGSHTHLSRAAPPLTMLSILPTQPHLSSLQAFCTTVELSQVSHTSLYTCLWRLATKNTPQNWVAGCWPPGWTQTLFIPHPCQKSPPHLNGAIVILTLLFTYQEQTPSGFVPSLGKKWKPLEASNPLPSRDSLHLLPGPSPHVTLSCHHLHPASLLDACIQALSMQKWTICIIIHFFRYESNTCSS